MFYEFDQNNSGGHFVVDDKLCHRLFIEADTREEATEKAEELGCYWDGVDKGIDCPCCGDRWYGCKAVDLEMYTYRASVYYGHSGTSAEDWWQEKYGSYKIVKKPSWNEFYHVRSYEGDICFKDIEETVDIRGDVFIRTFNTMTHSDLCCKMYHIVRSEIIEHTSDERIVRHISLPENKSIPTAQHIQTLFLQSDIIVGIHIVDT